MTQHENQNFLSTPEKLISAFEICDIGLWEWDLQTGRKIVDQGFIALLGYQPDEIEPTAEFWTDLIHSQDRQRVAEEQDAYLTGLHRSYESEYRVRTKEGSWKWIQDRGKIIARDPAGHPQSFFGIHKDIQQQKLAKLDLIQEKNKMEAVISALGDGLTVQDRDFRIVYQNEIQKKRQGEHQGEHCYAAYQGRNDICDGCLVAQCFQDGEVHRRETSATTGDGKELFMEVSACPLKDPEGSIIGAVETVRDITAKKLLERQLRQSQKLEAIGTLAGGIAHDFNNILGVIIGYAEIAKFDSPPGTKFTDDLDRVLVAANRAKDLVKQILSFSRQEGVQKTVFHPQPIVKELLNMIRSSLPRTIEIRRDISTADMAINADPTQLHQVLMNLCVNAFHAMEEKGGTLTVGLHVAEILPQEIVLKTADRKKGYTVFSVTDTGHGIGPDHLDRIFDPFFSTKGRGKGTGMGLATTYGIVKDFGGTITVESRVGRGTTFKVYLPIAEQGAVSAHTIDTGIHTGNERILFVDDEALLAEMSKHMLEKLGYQVTAKLNGPEALEAFRTQPDKFDLVVTDQTMPKMTGLELAQEIMQIRPDMPVILCTGYSSSIDTETAISQGVKAFAYKPLNKKEFAALIRNTLDGKPPLSS